MPKEMNLTPRFKQRPPAKVEGLGPPYAPFMISVNELNSFQRCRRAWDITSANRQSLHRVGFPTPALNIGSAVHYALAAQSLGSDPLAAVLVFFQTSVDEIGRMYKERVGTGLSAQEISILNGQRDEVIGMIRAYFARYGRKNPVRPFKVLAPELTFRIPLVPDYNIYLEGTIDRVLLAPDGSVVPGEVKTYKSAPKTISWRFNHQIYGYACALQILTGQKVRYAAYDGLRKKSPTVPKVLKDGTLSVAWIDTTYDVYREKLLEVYGGDKSILFEQPYAELLNRFKERDLSPESAFHKRMRVPISQHAMELWWDQAVAIATEMRFSPKIYPHFDWQGCPMCRIRDLCHVIQGGEDVEHLISTEFAVGRTHTRQAKLVATPKTVKSVNDLRKYAGSLDPDRPFEISVTPEADPS